MLLLSEEWTMQPVDQISSEELRAGRLLVQMTLAQLASRSGISHDTIQRLEAGRPVRPGTQVTVVCTLEAMGVVFHGEGFLEGALGQVAPTREAIGLMHGDRIRKARWRLAWTQEALASASGASLVQVRAMEASKFL